MSDITLNLDGVNAFLASAALAVFLVLALIAVWLASLMQVRGPEERFFRRPVFTHVFGIVASLCGDAIVMYLLFLNDGPSASARALSLRLDNWAPLWVAAVLALWPATWYLIKRVRMSTGGREAEEKE